MRIVPLVDPEPTRSSRRLAWPATLPVGTPVGSAFLRLFVKAGQDHLARLHVHPAEQRKGAGSLLLSAAVEAARQERRRCVIAQAEPGSPAEALLAARLSCGSGPEDGKGGAQHYGTGVLPEHRGHGLTRWMKAEVVRQAREPDTADSNRHMRGVNDALGHLPTHKTLTLQLDL
ncbi:GNAT family N-acetyltransferase [Nonomuraea wenchangensis]